MPAPYTVLAGPARSGKTARLLERYRGALADAMPGTTLWLAPNHRAAATVRERLLSGRLDACVSPGVMTFDQFADAVLRYAPRPVRPVSGVVQRILLERVVQQARADLEYFGPVADRPGLVEALTQLVRDLKRQEIWPDRLDLAIRRRPQPKDREILKIYSAYQQTLLDHELYDAEGRFWSAWQLIQERAPIALVERLRLVVVDGFSDFTPTQYDILAELGTQARELIITLVLEDDAHDRVELFAKSHTTLARLRERHPELHVERLARATPPSWPAMDQLERQLFRNPRRALPLTDTAGIELLHAPRERGEIELVGRRIKRLLLEGDELAPLHPVRPDDVVVVVRHVNELAPLFRETFDELGIPAAIEASTRLRESPAVAALVSLVELEFDNWPFRRVLDLLAGTFCRTGWREDTEAARLAAERVVRRLQLVEGRSALLHELARYAERLAAGDTPPRPEADDTDGGADADGGGISSTGIADDAHAADDARADDDDARADDVEPPVERRWQLARDVQLATPLLRRWAEALAALPQQATLAQWRAALTELADGVGLLRGLAPDEEGDVDCRPHWHALIEALEAHERLTGELDRAAIPLSRRELRRLLRDLAGWVPIPESRDEAGAVRVLSAQSVRGLDVPYLFFAGLSERSFPALGREDSLYSEADFQRLADQGLDVVLDVQRIQDEMLLFYEVITRATRRLFLSYPALDEKAQPLLPSPFLAELARLCDLSVSTHGTVDLSPVPRTPQPQSRADLRLLSVEQALHDQRADLFARWRGSAETRAAADNVLCGLRAIDQRSRGESLGPFEGVLDSPLVRQWAAHQFGPQRRWSASELEEYALCPFRFLLHRVLGVQEPDDLAIATDYAARGATFHDLLARLHRRTAAEVSAALAEMPLAQEPAASDEALARIAALLSARLEELLAECFRPAGRSDLELGLLEVDRRTFEEWCRGYFEQFLGYVRDQGRQGWREPLVPAHFEVSFGMELREEHGPHDPLSTEQPLVLRRGDDEVRLSGRIDRIDRGRLEDDELAGIIDYKTGRKRPGSRRGFDRRWLQLEVYAAAAHEVLFATDTVRVHQSGYWMVLEKGYRTEIGALSAAGAAAGAADNAQSLSPTWQERRQQLVDTIFELVDGIRAAQFPVYSADEQCTSRCPYRTVCRVNQVRALEKRWPPPPSND